MLQAADGPEFSEDLRGMGRFTEFGGEVLSGPMLIMLAVAPQARGRDIVNKALKGDPYFGFILTVA